MKLRYIKVAAAALAMLFSCSVATMAATHQKTTHIKVTAKVDPSCVNFTVGNITFGTLPAFPPYAVQTSNSPAISYKCTLGTSVELTGSGSCAVPSADTDTNWAMCDGSGHAVDYALYMAGSYVVEGGEGVCGPTTSVQEQQNVPFTNNETDYPYIDAGSGYTDSTGAIYVGNNTDHYSDHITLTLSY